MSLNKNRSRWFFGYAIMVIIFSGALVSEIGCTVAVQPAPGEYAQQPAPVVEYQPPPPDVLTVYDSDLDPYGSWVEVGGYGRCWAPNDRPSGWQPYTVGYWADTDYGWTWVAVDDESQWGDVTYHYGRWYNAPSTGWVWVPGVTWAPAWVAWREGGGYCGWAPLPPQAGFGVEFSASDADRYVPANQYVYCDERYVTGGRVDQHIVRNNVTIINQTTSITNITYVNNHIVNQGISADNVARATGRPVTRVALATASTPDEAHTLAAAGKPVIYAPAVVRQAETQRVAQSKTPAESPKYTTPPEYPQPAVEPAHNAPAGPSAQNPAKAGNGFAEPKQQNSGKSAPTAAPVEPKVNPEQPAAPEKREPGPPAAGKPAGPTKQPGPANTKEKQPPAGDDKAADDKKKPSDKPAD